MAPRATPPILIQTGAFIADTTHLNAEQTGALALLMMAAWKKPKRQLPDVDADLARIARLSLHRWMSRKAAILEGWRLIEGHWRINPGFIVSGRPPIPAAIRARILAVGRCTYCGTDQGPFEVDHVYPHARGGSSEENNLACACMSCNRAKGALTTDEWQP